MLYTNNEGQMLEVPSGKGAATILGGFTLSILGGYGFGKLVAIAADKMLTKMGKKPEETVEEE